MISIEKILHPTDFSANSNHALKYACAFATHFGAELHLLNVVVDLSLVTLPPIDGYLPEGYYQNARNHANEELAKMPTREMAGNIRIVRQVLDGSAFVEIINYAKNNDIDLIVMGTHGYSGLTHLVMGSIAEKVVRRSPCPVLTVHPENHEFVIP
ncbi:MAG: universal stress protein [Gammaproteobacteria bacterium]|nr:universal stress protein [Gammaproteobacteria bacterium]